MQFTKNKQYYFIGIGLILFFGCLTYFSSMQDIFRGVLPTYANAKIISAEDYPGMSEMVITTPDEAQKIFKFFKKQLIGKGWRVSMERYGMDIVLNQNGDKGTLNNDAGKNTATLVLCKDNLVAMLNTQATDKKTSIILLGED